MAIARPRDILDFWFAAGPQKWFAKIDAFDAEIRRNFADTYRAACEGRLDIWGEEVQGALALVLVLDQFSRNLWRGDHRAFAQDAKALALADESVRRRFDVEVPETARKWFYMPYMHAEDRAAQERGLICFTTRLHDPETLSFATEHAAIIRRFGRFPHRNAVLGRETTPEERSFLDEGGFTG
ncbi:MAG: DUF924 domain-containing protein [Alphaproteobacteria bacterium HGW-Alphaproteobacteria-12]|nr:MAG: DUF924 domain-containing protein [Alphaproteobacteria bacterium HGW-Alphaproteobacteria-12]